MQLYEKKCCHVGMQVPYDNNVPLPAYISTVPVPIVCKVKGLVACCYSFILVLCIRIDFNADPDTDTAFYLNDDPDPGSPTTLDPDPGQTLYSPKVEYHT